MNYSLIKHKLLILCAEKDIKFIHNAYNDAQDLVTLSYEGVRYSIDFKILINFELENESDIVNSCFQLLLHAMLIEDRKRNSFETFYDNNII